MNFVNYGTFACGLQMLLRFRRRNNGTIANTPNTLTWKERARRKSGSPTPRTSTRTASCIGLEPTPGNLHHCHLRVGICNVGSRKVRYDKLPGDVKLLFYFLEPEKKATLHPRFRWRWCFIYRIKAKSVGLLRHVHSQLSVPLAEVFFEKMSRSTGAA